MQAAHARPMAAFWLLAAVAAAISGLGMHDGPLSGPNLRATAPTRATPAQDVAAGGAQRGAKDEAQAVVPGLLLLPLATGAPAPRVATVAQATRRVQEVAVTTTTAVTVAAAKPSTAKSTTAGRPRSRTKVSSTSTRDAATTVTRPRHGRGHGGGAAATAASTQAPGHSGAAHGDHGVGRGH